MVHLRLPLQMRIVPSPALYGPPGAGEEDALRRPLADVRQGGEDGEPLTGPDDTDWNVGVQLSLPLFEGGARKADLRRNSESLEALRRQRESLQEKIELRIRASLFRIAASSSAIDLSAEAAGAARRNLAQQGLLVLDIMANLGWEAREIYNSTRTIFQDVFTICQ